MGIDVTERARRYISKLEVSVSGAGGSVKAMHCMCVLIHGFSLNDSDARALFSEWNQSCQPPWSDREIDRLLKNAASKESDKGKGYMLKGDEDYISKNPGVSRAPKAKQENVPKYDENLLKKVIAGVPDVDRDWFRARSPLPVEGITPGQFLESIFDVGQRILVFTKFFSQGDFLWEVGRGGYRLSAQEGTSAVRSELPTDGGKDGVWFLNQPVTGQWLQNPVHRDKKTRRSKNNVTQWRYAVLESDEADESDWLKLMAKLELPIAAMYSSGGRSIHALVRVDIKTYEELDDSLRKSFKKILCPLGADGGALTAVRLTRLPGCLRSGRMQELIYLNPRAEIEQFSNILARPPRP